MMATNYFVETVSKDHVHYQELQGSKLKKLLRSPFGNQLSPDGNLPVCMTFGAVLKPRNSGKSAKLRKIQIHVDTMYLKLIFAIGAV